MQEQAQSARSGAAAQVKTEQEPSSYTVASGDTLYRIALDHDIEGGWNTLYEANKKTVGGDPDLILPGQKLTLDTASKPAENSDDATPSAPTAARPSAPAACTRPSPPTWTAGSTRRWPS